jgi:replicative superfamily II helicase
MVDFSKRLAKKDITKRVDPIELYDTLDRASDKGELRTAQRAILSDWHQVLRSSRDLIVKLHTGQGKTLIGLLMLQSKLNEGIGPALYLCPNNFLIEQTCLQAKQFGIGVCTAEPELPQEFLSGEVILVASVQKLFNGLTRFGLGPKSKSIGTLLMDDSHACIDAIRDAFCMTLPKEHQAYEKLVTLFTSDLESQGAGTFADILEADGNDLLPVPYWAWQEKSADVTKILSKVSATDEVKFVWPLIRNELIDCQCFVSGRRIEISPYLAPLGLFGSYAKARHRIFMSATVTDDSFLVRGLRLEPITIRKPLTFEKEKWSGEKMILIPSLIDETLTRAVAVKAFAPPKSKKYGIVSLTPSFAGSKDWEAYGATIADKSTINAQIDQLRKRNFQNALVIVNRYDGIDLPDDTCRVLVFDSKPYSEKLADRYAESCRSSSEVTATRVARSIEQGLGRSVRGEKDYCVFVIIGAELVATVRSAESRKHLSAQTQAQIDIGLEIAALAKEDADKTVPALSGLLGLISQCVKRDPAWKEFYVERMGAIKAEVSQSSILDVFQTELEAELFHHDGNPKQAVQTIQSLVDDQIKDREDRGWYLQEMARYSFSFNKSESNRLQIEAHRKNQFLLKPRDGMQIDRITVVSQKRVGRILKWLGQFADSGETMLRINDMLSRLSFGARAERFESALDEIGRALGFECQRPDKQWGQGPDNLWGLRDGEYLLFECKSEVDIKRAEINKKESGQMNNSCAWFKRVYPGAKATNIMIIPTPKLCAGGGFNETVEIMRTKELFRFVGSIRNFFDDIRSFDLHDLSEPKIQELLDSNGLSVDSLTNDYSTAARSSEE